MFKIIDFLIILLFDLMLINYIIIIKYQSKGIIDKVIIRINFLFELYNFKVII